MGKKIILITILFLLSMSLFVFSCKAPDVVPPTINITSHTNGEYVKGTITISGTASDNESIASVQVSYNAGQTYNNATGTTSWSYSLDTTTVEDGNLSIAVKASDTSDLVNYKFVTLIVDNEPPFNLTINTHEDGDKVNGTITVAGNTSDALAVQKVECRVGATSSFEMASGTTSWSYTFDTTTYTDGIYQFTVKATDISGNETSLSINLDIDQSSDLPTLIIINPIEDQKISGFVSIVGTAVDDDGINRIELKIDDGDFEIVNGTNTWSKLWDTTVEIEGFHTITVKAVDLNNLEGSEVTIEVEVDQTVPSISMITPEVGAYISGTNVIVSGIASDNIEVEKVEIRVGNAVGAMYELATGTETWSKSINTTTFSDNAYTIWARVIDVTGLIGITSRPVTIDNTDPLVQITSHNNGDMVSGVIQIQGTSTDTVGVQKVEVKVGPLSFQDANGTTSWYYDFDTSTLPNRNDYVITARVTDFAGNTNEYSITNVIFDQAFPVIDSIKIGAVDVVNGMNIKGNVTITGTASDPDGAADISGIAIKVDSDPSYTDCTGTTNWTCSLNTNLYSNDSHSVNFKVIDSVGGYSVATRTLVFDNINPNAIIDSPPDNAQISTVVLVSGEANDNSDISNVEILIEASGYSDVTDDISGGVSFNNGYWSYSINALTYAVDTVLTFTVTATDLAGNTFSAVKTFIVSATAPWISVTSHTTGSYVRQTILLAGEAFGYNGIQNPDGVQIKIGASGSYQTVETIGGFGGGVAQSWSHTIDTTGLSDGLLQIQVQITDVDTNVANALLTLIVDNTPPIITLTYPTINNIGNDALYGTINVVGTVTDNIKIDKVEIDIVETGGTFLKTATIDGEAYSYSWDTATLTKIAENNVQFKPYATDKAGNVGYINNSGLDYIFVDVHPYISSLSTYSALIGDVITVNGFNFRSAAQGGLSTVTFDNNASGVNGTVTYVSSNQLTVTIPSGATSGNMYVKTNNIASNDVWINIWNIMSIYNDKGEDFASLAINQSNGDMYVPFYEGGPNKYLAYSKYNGSTWTTTTNMDNNPAGSRRGQYTSVAHSSVTNYVYFSYWHETNTELRLARGLNGAGFVFATIDTTGSVGTYTSLAVKSGATDTIHISYYDASGQLKYAQATFNGTTFTIVKTEVVDNGGGSSVGKYSSIALDTFGNPHISYYNETARSLKYARWDGSNWIKSTIDSGYVGEFSSIAVGTDNTIHISYYQGNDGDLKYAKSNSIGGNFAIETVPDAGIVGFYSSITLNSANKPYISYFDFSQTVIKYADKTGTEWNVVKIPESASVPSMTWTSIALTSADLANIVYSTSGGLKIARYLP